MLKEILIFLAGYSVGRSKSSFGRLFILGCVAYVLIAICIGTIFFLGVIYMIVKYLYYVGLAVTRLTHRIVTRLVLEARSKSEQ